MTLYKNDCTLMPYVLFSCQSQHTNMVQGLELMYLAVTDGHHYVGGTKKRCQFLKECGTYVPYSFVGYLSSGKTEHWLVNHKLHNTIIIVIFYIYIHVQAAEQMMLESAVAIAKHTKDSLRKKVEHLFNELYYKYYIELTL